MKTETFRGRSFIDAELDYTVEEYNTLIDVALNLKMRYALGETHSHLLKDKTIYLIFFNQSLRTRNSFEAGATQLGAHAHILDPVKIYKPALPGYEVPYSTERVSDVARTLERYGNAIAIRMYGDPAEWVYGRANEIMREFQKWVRIPIINMECDKYHPTQALADLITIKEKLGGFKKRKFVMSWAYSGSCHKPVSVPQSCVLATTKMGMDVVLAHPKGLDLDPEVIAKCKEFSKNSGGSFEITNDMDESFKDADIVYPKSWASIDYFSDEKAGKPADFVKMKELFDANKSWICTKEKLALAKPNALYMHCLPCDRGMEVTDEVVDGPQSVVFDEAENRLHAHKAIMALTMGGKL